MSANDPLARSPYFEGLPGGTHAAIRRAGRVARFAAGEVMVRPGERHRALHFVLGGALEVRLEEASGTVSRIGPGECFGEMSVIDGQPASAFVVGAEPGELLRVAEEQVYSELLPRPGFARALLRLLSERLRQTLEREASWEQVRRELRLASEIQASMLPPAGGLFEERPDLDCAAAMDPAAEVGGDFYDAFFLDERRLFFAVGDVAGKGIGAALFMARALTLLRSEALRRRPLGELVGRVNDALVNDQATFVALSCGVLDTANGSVRYANGGGGAPFLVSGGRATRLPMPRGLVVGAFPGFGYEQARARLQPGDALVLFSDGVTEARSPEGELYGEARLRFELERDGGAGAGARITRVRDSVRAFAASGRPADDLTLLVVGRPSSTVDAAPDPAP